MTRPAPALALVALLPALASCDPYADWPETGSYFPYVYTPEDDLEDYHHVRWETETWDPAEDYEEVGLYLLKAVDHRPSAPDESLEHFAQMRGRIPPPGAGTTLSLVGDVMWVGDNWAHYAEPAAPLLDGELRVGNLETPTSPDHPTGLTELGTYAFNAPPEMLDGLPLDLLQLNNNHSLDADDLGLENTVAEVEAREIFHLGVDTHRSVEVGDRVIRFLSYTWGINRRDYESSHELYVVPFGHLDEAVELDSIAEDIRRSRSQADAVVVLLHWGFEYEYYPDPHFMVLAREIIAAGADLIVGSGAHVLQPPEICAVDTPEQVPGIGTCSVRATNGEEEPRTAAVLYSLGNFGTGMATIPCQVGMVATATLDGRDVTGLGWAAAATVEGPDGPEVRPLEELLDEPEYAAEADRLDAHLGTGWRR